jgi:hypothetical protein
MSCPSLPICMQPSAQAQPEHVGRQSKSSILSMNIAACLRREKRKQLSSGLSDRKWPRQPGQSVHENKSKPAHCPHARKLKTSRQDKVQAILKRPSDISYSKCNATVALRCQLLRNVCSDRTKGRTRNMMRIISQVPEA